MECCKFETELNNFRKILEITERAERAGRMAVFIEWIDSKEFQALPVPEISLSARPDTSQLKR